MWHSVYKEIHIRKVKYNFCILGGYNLKGKIRHTHKNQLNNSASQQIIKAMSDRDDWCHRTSENGKIRLACENIRRDK